jgi:hypothetical protein
MCIYCVLYMWDVELQRWKQNGCQIFKQVFIYDDNKGRLTIDNADISAEASLFARL